MEKAIAHRANRVQVKQDEVVLELKRIALADPAMALGPDGSLLELVSVDRLKLRLTRDNLSSFCIGFRSS